MLFQTLSVSESAHLLLSDDNANWSYEGAHAMADYLNDLYEDFGPPEFGFDVVAIRCDYTEMSPSGLVDCYGYLLERDLPSDTAWAVECGEFMEELIEEIRDRSHCLIELDNGGYIVGDF